MSSPVFTASSSPGLALAIYDGVEPSPAALLLRIVPRRRRQHRLRIISANEYLVVGGHDWTLSMSAQDDFKARFGRNAEVLIAGTGTGLSLLLALLAWLMITGRGRAMRLASTMTNELRENEEKFRAIADCTVNWEVWWGPDGKPRWINPSVEEYTGYTVDECMAMPDFAGTLIHPDDMARVAPEFLKGLQGSARRRPRIPLRSQGRLARLAVRVLGSDYRFQRRIHRLSHERTRHYRAQAGRGRTAHCRGRIRLAGSR